MSGAQPKAAKIAGSVSITAEVNPKAAQKRHKQGWVDELYADLNELLERTRAALSIKEAVSLAYEGNVVDLWERLAERIRQVLSRSIETGGASIRDYVTPDGSDGGYQFERWVYARKGEPCERCGEAIRRIVLGQRGTHYCPSCQK